MTATPDLTPELLVEIRGLRHDVGGVLDSLEREQAQRAESERRERASLQRERRATRVMRAAVAITLLVVALWVNDLWRAERLDCTTRARSRTEIRAAIAAATDQLAIYADLSTPERHAVNQQIAAAVRDELPEPDC